MQKYNALELGYEGIIGVLKELLLNMFQIQMTGKEIRDDMVMMNGGLDLDSIERIKLLVEVEKTFGITFNEYELSYSDMQTLADLSGKIEKLSLGRKE